MLQSVELLFVLFIYKKLCIQTFILKKDHFRFETVLLGSSELIPRHIWCIFVISKFTAAGCRPWFLPAAVCWRTTAPWGEGAIRTKSCRCWSPFAHPHQFPDRPVGKHPAKGRQPIWTACWNGSYCHNPTARRPRSDWCPNKRNAQRPAWFFENGHSSSW